MDKGTDLKEIGKRMPYKVPDGFFDELRVQVAEQVKSDRRAEAAAKVRRSRHRRMAGIAISTALAAASVALFFVLPSRTATHESEERGNMYAVQQAYDNLSPEDQNYLMEIYQDDVLLSDE
jgi:hypothetical protein